jgi:hypothetical protein
LVSVFVVTHGDKFFVPNPGMTTEGFAQVRVLRRLLPENPPTVVCGTGTRFIHVAAVLGLEPTRYTAVVGGPDSLEIVDGKKVIVLADGTTVEPAQYTTLADEAPAAKAVVASLPDGSIVCAGRASMIMLGEPNAKSAAVYRVMCENGQIAVIEEVAATGVSETGTV